MPVLDAKALETDPVGMAFLRSVIRPGFEREGAVTPPPARRPRQPDAASDTSPVNPENVAARSEAKDAVPVD